MRYAIVDIEGASREYFESRVDAREAIREVEEDAPGAASDLYVVAYDDEGNEVGSPERGDELLNGPFALDWRTAPSAAGTVVFSASANTTERATHQVATQQFAGASR